MTLQGVIMNLYNTMDNTMEEKKTMAVAMAAIDKSYISNLPEPTEYTMGKDYVYWGSDNGYANYLWNLFNDCDTLRTIILGTADYVQGDDVRINDKTTINKKGDTAREFVNLLAKDYLTYGGFAFQVIKDKEGNVVELYWLDFRYVRTSKDGNVIFYSEDFGKRYARSSKVIKYPSFNSAAKDVATSVIYYKNEKSHVYPTPVYIGALKACEIERNIDEFHLSALLNGFAPSFIINFASGIPSDPEKAELERQIQEKFAGASNAGAFMLNFSNGKDNAAEIIKLDTPDFGEKYKAAADRARQQIYTAFRAVPCIFGLTADQAKGFSKVEFNEAYNLYNKTVVRSIQRLVCDEIDKVYGVVGSVNITPFSLEDNKAEEIID